MNKKALTVEELIELLSRFPKDARVIMDTVPHNLLISDQVEVCNRHRKVQ